MPGKMNGSLRLHFWTWTDAETAWMTRATLEPSLYDFEASDFEGEKVWLGLDLSQNKDITALATCMPDGFVESGEHKGKPK